MIDTNVSDRLFLTVDEQVRRLVAWMTEGVYEKEPLAAMALLCAVAGENIFLLGPPGTAK
ncbi:MAG: ATPase, partial [Duncaniella sp.]|nr:ATPase [Duncaniella sp.]